MGGLRVNGWRGQGEVGGWLEGEGGGREAGRGGGVEGVEGKQRIVDGMSGGCEGGSVSVGRWMGERMGGENGEGAGYV